MLSSTFVDSNDIDRIYNDIISVLINAEAKFVPKSNKSFYKFWWNEELSLLKQSSVESSKMWKLAGKPRMVLSSRDASPVDRNIADTLENMNKCLLWLTLTSYMKPCCRKMELRFGSVGVQI